MQDILDRLDAELATAPAPTFDLSATIASGRRAVRRRRLAVSGAGVAAALVVAGTAWLVVPGAGDIGGRDGEVAGDPTSSPAAPMTTVPPDVDDLSPRDVVLTADDGTLTLNPAAEVIERARFGAGGEMIHLALGEEEYYVLTQADGSFSTQQLPAQGLTLREWASQNDGGGGIVDENWVEFDEGSHVVVAKLDGLTVVRQLPDPGLGANFAGPGDPTALVEARLDGATYFLAVRSLDGGRAEGISYRRDEEITTLEEFRTFAVAQYEGDGSGGSEGLR